MADAPRPRARAASSRLAVWCAALALAASACAPKVECPKKKYEPPDERFVFFTLARTEINAEGHFTIGYVAAQLDADPALQVLVVGHADAQGRSETNHELSRKRARAVRKVLVERGVKQARVLVAIPHDHGDATSAQLNRRADLFVFDPRQDQPEKRVGYAVDLERD